MLLPSNTTRTNMLGNSSSSINILMHCTDSIAAHFISIGFIFTRILLLLPLSILVLHTGHQRMRQQRVHAATSHSDMFSYHAAAMELTFVFGITLYLWGFYTGLKEVITVGIYVFALIYPGQIGLHILTCVERYLAVVHPVTYLRLRLSAGVRIRNTSIGCVWLLCFGWCGVTALYLPDIPLVPFTCLLVLSIVLNSFCSFGILRVLIRPGPGNVGGNRERVDQSKQKAFNVITAILGAHWLNFAGNLICLSLDNSQVFSYSDSCMLLASANWFTLPTLLMFPLQFLHRAGKRFCCNNR